MLDNVAVIFDDMDEMLRKLKKVQYEERMEYFRNTHGHYIDEMISSVEAAEDKNAAADEAAGIFSKAAYDKFAKNGKIKSYKQVDLNFFMVYYVFPAILLTGKEDATTVCDALKNAWNGTFKDTNISYTDYDTLYKSFRTKIFGIF